jgi:hypothetical protein
MKHKLHEILHYHPSERNNSQLKKSLLEYKFLVTALDQAIFHFEKGNLEKFDSLVGENACQIRAVKIAKLAGTELDFCEIKEQIIAISEKIDVLMEGELLSDIPCKEFSLEQVINHYDLDVDLSKDQMFLIQAFLLSEMKAPQDKDTHSLLRIDKSSPTRLRALGEITSSFSFNLGRKLRRLLSEASVKFVKELAWNLGDVTLLDAVSDHNIYFHNDAWPCLPMFWTYEILLKTCLKEGIPLILKAKFLKPDGKNYQFLEEETLFFKSVKGSNNFSLVQPENTFLELKKPACVISGTVVVNDSQHCKVRWKEKMLNYGILDAILAGAADHRQYPNPNRRIEIEDSKFRWYLEMAKTKGFSLNNPSMFFINHVFSSQVRNFPELINNETKLAVRN